MIRDKIVFWFLVSSWILSIITSIIVGIIAYHKKNYDIVTTSIGFFLCFLLTGSITFIPLLPTLLSDLKELYSKKKINHDNKRKRFEICETYSRFS